MGIPDRHGREHRRRRRRQLAGRDGGPHYSPAGTLPPSLPDLRMRRSDIAGMVTVGALAVLIVASAADGMTHRGELAPGLAVIAYLLVNVWAAALAILADHPRRSLVVWLTLPALLGLFPFTIITWMILLADRRRPAGRWGASVTAAHDDTGGSVAELPGRGVAGQEATQADYARLALLEIEAALAITNRAGLGLGYPVPPWVDGTLDHLLEAKDAIEHLTGAAGPDPAA